MAPSHPHSPLALFDCSDASLLVRFPKRCFWGAMINRSDGPMVDSFECSGDGARFFFS
jgi:hypothetical protein